MAQPTPYSRLYNFTEYATANPSAPYQASYTDSELNAIATTLRETLINLSLIQRDDGALKNGVVTQDSLSTTLAALFAAEGSTIRGDWVTATAYALKDVVTQGGVTYLCAVAHTSGTFNTDLAADKWVALNSGTTISAANVTNTPAGNIVATDAQTAINELDTEKLAKASNLSDLASRTTAFANLVAGGGEISGPINFYLTRINETAANMTAAASMNFDTAQGNFITISAGTSISAITLTAGREAVCYFIAGATITHGASLVCPGGASIVANAGDVVTFRGYSGGVVVVASYQRASGVAVAPFPLPALSCSVSGGQLSISIPAQTPLVFNNSVSMVLQTTIITKISNGSTAGMSNGVAARIWAVAMYNSGTPELAWINTWDGTDVYEILTSDTISTTAEGAAGAADSAHTWYSTTARSSQPICILGYCEVTQATAGTWVTSPSLVASWGPGMPLPGQVIQTRRARSGSLETLGTGTTPQDGTIPQVGEGNAVASLSLTFTPKSALNLARLTYCLSLMVGSAQVQTAHVHQDGGANAIVAGSAYNAVAPASLAFTHTALIGTAAATTYALRIGGTGGYQNYLNANSSGTSAVGSVGACTARVEEIMR